MNNFSKDIAVVTGAGSGIGKAVAKHLSAVGVSVVLLDIELKSVQSVAQELMQQGGKAFFKQIDISNQAAVIEVIDWIVNTVGTPSMLCNCAAIQHFGRTESFSFEAWKQIIDVNLSGTFLMCQTLLPHLVTTQGSIVNVASLAGSIGIPYDAAYSASKGGVITLTKALAKEYADRNVRVNVITPGAVDTPMLAMDIPTDINPEVLKVIPRSARQAASPDDIAQLIVFLCKDAPGAMTGSIIPIDGAAG